LFICAVAKNVYVYFVFGGGGLRGKDKLGELGVDETIILKYIFRKWNGEGEWTGLFWRRIGQVAFCCKKKVINLLVL
jgi:hypothetical protein